MLYFVEDNIFQSGKLFYSHHRKKKFFSENYFIINHNSTNRKPPHKTGQLWNHERKKTRMEPVSLFPHPIHFDYRANRYIVCAYKVGFSVKLINNRLIEHDYGSTTFKIEKVLRSVGAVPDGYNCFQDSQTWEALSRLYYRNT